MSNNTSNMSANDLLTSIQQNFGECGTDLRQLIESKCMNVKKTKKKSSKPLVQRQESAYIRFCKIRREEIKKEREEKGMDKLTLGTMQQLISKDWGLLSDEQKLEYKVQTIE